MKTVILTGCAGVTFKKVIHGMCQEEIDEITDVDEILNVEYVSMEYEP